MPDARLQRTREAYQPGQLRIRLLAQYDIPMPLVKCPVCDGSGRYQPHIACSWCVGAGNVTQGRRDHFLALNAPVEPSADSPWGV